MVPTYDVRLAKTLEAINPDSPIPPLWNQFDALSTVPVMVDPRRQFGHPVASNGRGDARAARRGSRRSKCRTRATRRF